MKKLLFAFLLYQSALVIGAAQNLDSLWGVWNDKTQPDTTRLKAMHRIVWDGYLYNQPDSAFYFAQIHYDLAEKKGLKGYMALALNNQGISLAIRGNNPKALDYYQRSLTIREEMGDKFGMAYALSNIGNIYNQQGDYPKALDYYQRCLKIMHEIGNKQGLSIILKQGLCGILINIGVIYSNQGDNPKALDYFQRCLKIAEEIGEKIGISTSLNNIGNIYMDQGDYPKALDNLQRSLKISEEIGDKNEGANCLNSLGSLYQKQGDHQQAINQCSKGLLLAQEIEAINFQRDACKCLYDAYKSTGNTNQALAYHEQYIVLKDSLFNEENTKKLTQLEMQYDFDKKEAAAQLEQEKKDALAAADLRRNKLIRNGFIAAFTVMLLFSLVFLTQRNKIKKGKKQSDDLLLNILPAEVAEELKANGKTEAKHFDEATILFTDFKGFTEQSAKLSAQDLVLELNTCFKAFDGIMDNYKIEKIKTIGDAYMAASGINTDGINELKSAKLMVLAALEMQDFIAKRKAENDAANKPAFEMRVGIHTGPVVAGIVGVKKFQYDIWGDTVNTASRMESAGEVGKVNISQATYELLKDNADFAFESRGKIEAKGKGEMEMYFVRLAKAS